VGAGEVEGVLVVRGREGGEETAVAASRGRDIGEAGAVVGCRGRGSGGKYAEAAPVKEEDGESGMGSSWGKS
jgi:hypothetical protein